MAIQARSSQLIGPILSDKGSGLVHICQSNTYCYLEERHQGQHLCKNVWAWIRPKMTTTIAGGGQCRERQIKINCGWWTTSIEGGYPVDKDVNEAVQRACEKEADIR